MRRNEKRSNKIMRFSAGTCGVVSRFTKHIDVTDEVVGFHVRLG